MPELRQDVAYDGTTILKSSLLQDAGFPHAFSTRLGPDGSVFDLSRPGFSQLQTPPEECEKSLARFAELLAPEETRTICTPRQVHGCEVVDATEANHTEADIVISDDPHSIAAVRTADCVGILLACPKTGTVAAVHAGWRGLVADAPRAAVLAMHARTETAPESLLAAIGPAIGVGIYEVGLEVAEAFREANLGVHIQPGLGPKPHLDLHTAAVQRLKDAGLALRRIDGEPLCTSAESCFFSYRRDGPKSGRLLAGIASICGGTA